MKKGNLHGTYSPSIGKNMLHGNYGNNNQNSKFLLDQYPGAVCGIGVRKLSSKYNGPIIRIRRDSDNAEQDIYSDAGGENLDLVAIRAFGGTGICSIRTAYDQSGSGNHFTQANNTQQPLIYNNNEFYNQSSLGVGNKSAALKPVFEHSTGRSLTSPSGFMYNYTMWSMYIVHRVYNTNNNAGLFGPTSTNSTGIEIVENSVVSRRALIRINNVI